MSASTNKPKRRYATLLENAIWFGGALVLAFIVWALATVQSDPVEQWRLVERVPIRLTPAPGLIITNQNELTTTASVTLRAQRSVRLATTGEDVVVWADLSTQGAGAHVVPLQAVTARQAQVVDISPRQVAVELEVQNSQFVPLRERVSEPPIGFQRGETIIDARQVMVTGPASRVEQVVAAEVEIRLNEQRTNYSADLRVTPVNVDGNPVTGVTLDPAIVHVEVPVQQRPDVREVRVRPNIVGELPEGYILTSFSYAPQVVYVGGSVERLNNLPGTVFTAPITLSNRTGNFTLSVPVELPDPELFIISGENIEVRVEIQSQIGTRQFDGIPVEIAGRRGDLIYTIAPEEVTALVTGEQPFLQGLSEDDVHVVIDLNGMSSPGSYQAVPRASIAQGTNAALTIAVLPAEISVTITMPEVTPEVTPPVGS